MWRAVTPGTPSAAGATIPFVRDGSVVADAGGEGRIGREGVNEAFTLHQATRRQGLKGSAADNPGYKRGAHTGSHSPSRLRHPQPVHAGK